MNDGLLKRKVRRYFKLHKRNLPWRNTIDPYAIWVSEIMLQQTQVARVIEKYTLFLTYFPNVESLARAKSKDVLQIWQGLGYNRRAKNLHKTAQYIVDKYGGEFPRSKNELKKLPGIGEYTSAAICVFAYNMPEVLIETNIRSVYIHHYFQKARIVNDKKLLPLLKRTLGKKNPREWYNALMDYGAMLKSQGENPSRKSSQYKMQAKFKGSIREARGKILAFLLEQKKPVTKKKIISYTKEIQIEIVEKALEGLIKDNFLIVMKKKISLS